MLIKTKCVNVIKSLTITRAAIPEYVVVRQHIYLKMVLVKNLQQSRVQITSTVYFGNYLITYAGNKG